MANIRILYNNAADRATVTGSTTAGTLAATNVQTDLKSVCWRSTSGACSLTFVWTAAESISMVAIPFCTLTSAATVRVQGYTNAGDVTASVDSGVVSATPYTMPKVTGLVSGVNSWGSGGAQQAIVYIPATSVKQITITFAEPVNAFVEVGRVTMGAYWESSVNVPYGSVTMGMGDDSSHTRSEAGDIFTNAGPRYKTLDLSFQYLATTDRDNLWRILRGNGMQTPIFIDVVPGTTDYGDQFIYSIYGKLSKSSTMVMTMFNQYASSISWTEI